MLLDRHRDVLAAELAPRIKNSLQIISSFVSHQPIPTKYPRRSDWEPYTRGRWVHTDRYGWYFASDEPFAWAVYHYGRWAFEPGLGWYWVPGTIWAPAWVSWRQGDDHIGWAPLPPEGDGFAVRVEVSSSEPPRGYWHFVPIAEFAAPSLVVVIVDDGSFFDRTEYVGPVVVENNIVINTVIDIDFVRERTTTEIKTVDVQVVADPAEAKSVAEQGAVFAVEGELASPMDDAAPEEVVEPTQVEAPTASQDLEAPADEPAGEAE